MSLFRKKEQPLVAGVNDLARRRRTGRNEPPNDETLREEFTGVTDIGDPKEIGRADSEVKVTVAEANKSDIRNIMLIDQGRCPQCQGRLERFLFTDVCPSCGWYRRKVPEIGHSIVHLNDGKKIVCDYVHRGKDEFLCIKDEVVIAEVMRSSVFRIEHAWKDDELERARENSRRLREGICSWCEKPLSESEHDDAGEDYVAFGTTQEHYFFCSEKCQRAFRKQYPSRIHRNCYETDCNQCTLCIKRFDTRSFKRRILR
jgi:hypothetical protein